MQKLLIPTLCLCVAFMLTACPMVKHQSNNCNYGILFIGAKGFDTSDFNSAKVFIYDTTGSFTAAIDSGILLGWNYGSGFYLNQYYYSSHSITAGHDYIVQLPAIGRSYRLSAMRQSGVASKAVPSHNPPYTCFNDIVTVNINDTPYATHFDPNRMTGPGWDTVWLVK